MGGVTAQLMSDFQMSRVSQQPVLTPMQGLSQVQTTPFEGGSLPGTQLLSAPLGRALAQTQDACNGGRAGCETVTVGVCTGAAGRAARLPHWPDDWYAPGSEQLLLASFILQVFGQCLSWRNGDQSVLHQPLTLPSPVAFSVLVALAAASDTLSCNSLQGGAPISGRRFWCTPDPTPQD